MVWIFELGLTDVLKPPRQVEVTFFWSAINTVVTREETHPLMSAYENGPIFHVEFQTTISVYSKNPREKLEFQTVEIMASVDFGMAW